LVDDDAAGKEVEPTDPTAADLTGEPLSEIGFGAEQAKKLVPSGYQIVSLSAPDTYDTDPASVQDIVVHLSHIHTLGELKTTRTITYEGAGDLTPGPVVQAQTFATDKDQATGVTTYSGGAGYPAAISPEVAGHWPLTAQVPAVAAGAPTTVKPVDSTVVVTYVTDEPQVLLASEHGLEGGATTVTAHESFDPRGNGELEFAWDLDGDGEYDDATGPEAPVDLPLAGSYTVHALATDSLGRTSAASFEVLAANVTPVIDIGKDLAIGADGALRLEGSFTDPGADEWAAEVSYGDGSDTQKLTLNGQSFKLDHKYAKAGVYTVTVRISDVVGGTTGEATIKVTVPQGLEVTGPEDLRPVSILGGTLAALGVILVLWGWGIRRRRA
jgi:hypothetical protein